MRMFLCAVLALSASLCRVNPTRATVYDLDVTLNFIENDIIDPGNVDQFFASGVANFGPVTLHPGDSLNLNFFYFLDGAPEVGPATWGPQYYTLFFSLNGPGHSYIANDTYFSYPWFPILLPGELIVPVTYAGPRFPGDGITISQFEAVQVGIPEPHQWALLLIGFATVGALGMRRNRRLWHLDQRPILPSWRRVPHRHRDGDGIGSAPG